MEQNWCCVCSDWNCGVVNECNAVLRQAGRLESAQILDLSFMAPSMAMNDLQSVSGFQLNFCKYEITALEDAPDRYRLV